MTTPSEPTPGTEATGPPPSFDRVICHILSQAAAAIFARYPGEVRGIAALVDYRGTFNDAAIQKGIWVSEHGVVDTGDGIVGSMFQTVRLLEEQLARGIAFCESLRAEASSLSTALLELHQQHEQLQKEIEAAESARAAAGTPPEGHSP